MAKFENEEPILLDKEGYEKFLAEIEQIKEELAQNDKERGRVCSDAVGDGMHDNFAYDEVMRRESHLTAKLKERYEQLKRVKIIEKTDDEELVEAGDILLIDLISPTGVAKEYKVKIASFVDSATDRSVQEASLSSPLGKAIYHKHIGDQASYSVNGKCFTVKIKNKVKDEEKTDDGNSGKVR